MNNFIQDSFEFLNELNQVVSQLSLVLIAIRDGFVFDESNVVLNLWNEATAKNTLFSIKFV